MPLDALTIKALGAELHAALAGCRIDKIQQPERDLFLLSLRGIDGNKKLLISAGGGAARMHLTQGRYENPPVPPMFCMLMRKHFGNGKILSVTQPGLERILDIHVESYDELGEKTEKHMIAEFMGRYANFILTDGAGLILDCVRRIDLESNSQRQLLPGLRYRLPPSQKKLDPLTAQPGDMEALLDAAPAGQRLDQWLLDSFFGLSPLICRELVYRCFGVTDQRWNPADGQGKARLLAALSDLAQRVQAGDFVPTLLLEGGLPREFSCFPIGQYQGRLEQETMASFSQLLETYYTKRDQAERMRQRSQSLTKAVTTARDRVARKLDNQAGELTAAADRDRYRENGDIITANIYAMKKGMQTLRAQDFYDPSGGEREIALDPLKTPQQNAAWYYKLYNKAKAREQHLTEQIEKGTLELQYLNSVLEAIGQAEGERDLAEIRRELVETGYLKQQNKGRREKPKPPRPDRFCASDGTEILVGKNNSQNDELTFRIAYRGDTWLHTQKIHGSHVVICSHGEPPAPQTLEEAAVLAAWYSQGRQGTHVPVDYTLVKYVKRPPNARPGMAIYTDYKTIYVTPDEGRVERLRANAQRKNS